MTNACFFPCLFLSLQLLSRLDSDEPDEEWDLGLPIDTRSRTPTSDFFSAPSSIRSSNRSVGRFTVTEVSESSSSGYSDGNENDSEVKLKEGSQEAKGSEVVLDLSSLDTSSRTPSTDAVSSASSSARSSSRTIGRFTVCNGGELSSSSESNSDGNDKDRKVELEEGSQKAEETRLSTSPPRSGESSVVIDMDNREVKFENSRSCESLISTPATPLLSTSRESNDYLKGIDLSQGTETESKHNPFYQDRTKKKLFRPLKSLKRTFDKHKKGTIDVYWMFDDGGLTLLIPEMLRKRSDLTTGNMRILAAATKKNELDKSHGQ